MARLGPSFRHLSCPALELLSFSLKSSVLIFIFKQYFARTHMILIYEWVYVYRKYPWINISSAWNGKYVSLAQITRLLCVFKAKSMITVFIDEWAEGSMLLYSEPYNLDSYTLIDCCNAPPHSVCGAVKTHKVPKCVLLNEDDSSLKFNCHLFNACIVFVQTNIDKSIIHVDSNHPLLLYIIHTNTIRIFIYSFIQWAHSIAWVAHFKVSAVIPRLDPHKML